MNLKEYKNFLINNIDEQAEWPYILQQRLEEMGPELDSKIASVNQRKEEIDEENRIRIQEHLKRWDVYKKKAAELREIQRLQHEKELRKRTWIVLMTARLLVAENFYGKFKGRAIAIWNRDRILRATRKIMYRLRRIVSHNGPTHAMRTHRTLKDALMAFAVTGGKDLLEERAKDKLKSFLEATRDIKSIHTSLVTFHKKSKITSHYISLVRFIQYYYKNKKMVMEKQRELLLNYFEREKERMIMTKIAGGAKDKQAQDL
jgi:hypothetical protein